jgi:hypothetical protein
MRPGWVSRERVHKIRPIAPLRVDARALRVFGV